MPCLFALLAVAFPRVAIVLLWFFTRFFAGVRFFTGVNPGIVILLGFLFLPLTLIVYTYIHRVYPGALTAGELVVLFIAVIIDLGLVGGAWGRRG